MDEGTLLEWYVQPGDDIDYGDVIALLDTEKAEIEMQAFESGTIESLLIEPGETVPVGHPIATLVGPRKAAAAGRPGEASGPQEMAQPGTGTAPRAPVETMAPATYPSRKNALPPPPPHDTTPEFGSGVDGDTGRIRATPLARRLARERGIDLATVSGTGPHGAITEHDLMETSRARRKRDQPSRHARRREIIAAAMTRSKREIPHYYLSTRIGVDRASDWLAAHNQDRTASDRFVLAALLMKSVAMAAKRFTEMNGHWLDDGFRPGEAVHLGMAVSLRTGGLIIPTFQNADERPLQDLMAELRDVVGRARAGRLRSGELGDATLTITSLGDDGADTIFGVIYPPQVAIVGFGGIRPALRVEGDLHGTQSVLCASLAADHRVSDGQRGSQFLREIAKNLNHPEQL